ncbi:MAG: hypothetical protein CVV64_09635 [Candidatus Wallbacteria bacterium HGW-Wallbacteria-1]|jgi:tyrosine-protein kinase Etk/Wzc|uniref:non-specific protein-tyrosine kinase n=1 Tax=Candidatus Wallbacteria bacterium HGW-Wallbacteria-1 TaxID=2013854 RepID=A0A2N1PQJ6_9BACT|nr:MAG: hypothetical protein CVV64_09635 [Candidatus Wallbacteria bacterium HGW-Wallbacteria-1]
MKEEIRKEFSLHDYFHVIEKRLVTVISTIVIVVGLVALFNWRQIPTYVTSGKVMVERARSVIQSLNVMQSLLLSLNNYIEIIKSRKFLGKVVDKINETEPGIVTLEDLQDKISVSPVPGTDLLEIKGLGSDPKVLKMTVDTVIDFFVRDSEEVQGDVARGNLEYLKNQLDNLEEQLRTSERDLREFQQREKVYSLPKEMEQFHQDLIRWQSEKTQLDMELELTEKAIESLTSELKTYAGMTGLGGDKGSNSMESELSALEREYATASKLYKGKHPKLIEVRQKISAIKKSFQAIASGNYLAIGGTNDPIFNELKTQLLQKKIDIFNMRVKRNSLEELIKDKSSSLENVPEKNLVYVRLSRKLSVTEKIYSSLLQKFNEAQIQASSMTSKARVVDYSREPKEPIMPNKKLNLFIAFVASIITGIGFAFLKEHLDKSIKTSEEAKIIFERPVLGLVPQFRSSELKESRKVIEKSKIFISPSLLTYSELNTMSSESFRTMRTNILYANDENQVKTLLLTNAQAAAGKSTVVANIAISFAQIDKRVLVVDADLRKPIMHKLFNLDNSMGLTNALLGADIEGLISRTSIKNLDIMTSGPLPPNPSELLASSRMVEVIEICKANYDLVIFDSPPVIAVTDAAVIASKVDGVLYLVSLRRVARKQAEKGMELLENVNANVFGVVCNFVKERELGGYYYRYGYI